MLLLLLLLLLQESKAASELADKVLGDVQRSSNDMAQLNSWLQVCSSSLWSVWSCKPGVTRLLAWRTPRAQQPACSSGLLPSIMFGLLLW
jgi:hypothetical protein